jgi:DNA ligase-1
VDAVLINAQPGHGGRSGIFAGCTFGLWENGRLVPVAKAALELSDAEVLQVDAFVRAHTAEKFGPIRVVKPELVFELAFDSVEKSSRHKTGLAMRHPRVNRWRRDKTPEDASTLDHLRSLMRGAVRS